MATREEKMEAFGQLLDILDELRVKCPWDRKQTNESLRTNTIEETYELCEALMREDNTNIKGIRRPVIAHRLLLQDRRGKRSFRYQGCLRQPLPETDLPPSTRIRRYLRRYRPKVEQSWEQLKLKEKGVTKPYWKVFPLPPIRSKSASYPR